MGIPLLIHLILSFLYIYPFYMRFTLYTAVFSIVFIAFGIKFLVSVNKKVGIIISSLLLITIIIHPAKNSFTPIEFEEIKPSLHFIQENLNKDDIIYVFGGSVPSFQYYQKRYFDNDQPYILGKWIGSDLQVFDKELVALTAKKRVWILLSHYNIPEKDYIIQKCSEIGNQVKHIEYGGAAAYLFSFN